MAERLHRSSDVPAYDTYPAPPPVNENAHIAPDHMLETGRAPSALEQRASDLGTAAGKVVSIVKQARLTVERLPEHPVFDRLGHLAENARARAEYLRSVASERAQQLAHSAREKTLELRQQAKTGYYRARLRANQTARDYPVHVALAAGVVGFLIGVGLRIRRANNRAY